MKNAIILFKFPSRSRPQKFKTAMESILNNLARPDLARFLFTLDSNDPTFPEYDKVTDELGDINLLCVTGESKNKIDAINRNMEDAYSFFPDWEILICMSDDMSFVKKGFDDLIRNSFDQFFPQGDGVLHFNDGNQKENVMTLAVMDRKYYERTNYIYNPKYKSVWCDVEQTEVAFMLGKLKYMGDDVVICRHLHPAWGLSQYDEQYKASENLDVWGADLLTVIEAKENNYGLKESEIKNPFKYPLSSVNNWKIELNNTRQNNGLKPIQFK